MKNLQNEILLHLRTGNADTKARNVEIVNTWGREGAAILMKIAKGDVPTENPKQRTRALKALTEVAGAKGKYNAELKNMFSDASHEMKFHILSALTKLNKPREITSLLTQAVADESNSPAVSLFAARHLAELKTKDAVNKLKALKARFLPLVNNNERSPSVLALTQLISIAEGKAPKAKPHSELKAIV